MYNVLCMVISAKKWEPRDGHIKTIIGRGAGSSSHAPICIRPGANFGGNRAMSRGLAADGGVQRIAG